MDEITEVPEEEPIEEPEDEATEGEANALEKANQYLDFMEFYKKGLGEQLDYEGYSKSEIKYALGNIEADWDEQAVLKAENYLDTSAFSRKGLIDQLRFEGFTRSQAEHGVKENGL